MKSSYQRFFDLFPFSRLMGIFPRLKTFVEEQRELCYTILKMVLYEERCLVFISRIHLAKQTNRLPLTYTYQEEKAWKRKDA